MPQQPSWVHADSEPGQTVGTNETQPRFAGIADPGTVIKFSVDGKETTVVPTDEGSWTFDVPELEDGEHEFEMWAEDANGDESDHIEWENDVQAGAEDRANQRARNAEWNKPGGEAEQFINKNDEFQRSQRGTPPSPVSGGGGSQAGGGSGSGSGGSGSGGTGGSEEVGVGGVRSGTGGGGGGGNPPAGLEKGNAGTIGYLPG